jgi:hypothetical protein
MTHAELLDHIKVFQTEHGVEDTINLLNDTILATAQAAGLEIEYYDEDDEAEPATVHAVN